MLPSMHMAGAGSRQTLTISVTTNQTNFNLKTAIEALYGTVTTAADIVCTISAGVKIGSSSTGTAAFRTGGFPSGSSVKVINYGRCAGKGGDGGDGSDGTPDNGGSGADGGDAVSLDENAEWDNTSDGQVFGGGGGGGGGAGIPPSTPGGGGGGGRGDGGGAGGSGPGVAQGGGDGDETAPGSGGGNGGAGGGKGGKGGGWGQNGSSGAASGPGNGGPRGSAGKAVALNGHTINWLAGNNATQVKGAVS